MHPSPPSFAPSSQPRLHIVVLGYVVRGPLGGMAWHHLNYVLGLARLGHSVLFVEDSDDYASCYDPQRHVVDTDPTYGLRFAVAAFGRLGLHERWCYFDAHTNRWLGPAAPWAAGYCAGADMVLNVSGVNPLRPWTEAAPIRVFVDTDPGFTQVRNLTDPARRALCEAHNRHVTFGENIPAGRSEVPDDGIAWQPTRQPVVLDAWPTQPSREGGRFTTVMQWESYPPRAYGGMTFGMKSQSFAPYMDLPRMLPTHELEIALGGERAPRIELVRRGWSVVDSLEVTQDPWAYQAYIHGARGEWSVAKHGYVAAKTGWFSERSACFLASGKPVIVQDTGLSALLPTGQGLLTFSTADDAAEALNAVEAEYESHCFAARRLAESHFASDVVLPALLDMVETAPMPPAAVESVTG